MFDVVSVDEDADRALAGKGPPSFMDTSLADAGRLAELALQVVRRGLDHVLPTSVGRMGVCPGLRARTRGGRRVGAPTRPRTDEWSDCGRSYGQSSAGSPMARPSGRSQRGAHSPETGLGR